mgnify:CR=1 FL=1
MARTKSTPGSKAGRTSAGANNSNEQPGNGVPANAPQTAPVAAGTTAAEAAAETKAAPESRKFEVVKAEQRKNVLPINMEEEIRRRAYELYQQRGSAAGSESEDWFRAEREVRQRYRQQSAQSA